jgi:hypothetical protein
MHSYVFFLHLMRFAAFLLRFMRFMRFFRVFSQDDDDAFSCACGNATVTYLHPMAANKTVMAKLRRTTGLISQPDVDLSFYYDATYRIIRDHIPNASFGPNKLECFNTIG